MAFSNAMGNQKLKVLFVLGFPNPFPGAGWTRIGFLAEDWSKKGHSIKVVGAFNFPMFSSFIKTCKTKFYCYLKTNNVR